MSSERRRDFIKPTGRSGDKRNHRRPDAAPLGGTAPAVMRPLSVASGFMTSGCSFTGTGPQEGLQAQLKERMSEEWKRTLPQETLFLS
ncbi:hypothetical protein EYF80_043858 [Liparis tanakae]|uniref:Uncharacterized protein n=1 Tax=Liparis tanakae TaxID=230148 RepID=A0A4Z2FXF4_9TELE|nr:hypothetical protein EYF80_043858 [Liparis tanakae]